MSDTILATIFDLMVNETEDQEKMSNNLQSFYDDAIESEKKVANNIIISLCGYSLDTIIYHPENITS